jgi:enoyl-CoA hydratase/carnithine racemase
MLSARKYPCQAAIYYGVSHKENGLGNKVVPDDKRMGKAMETAHNIAQDSPFSLPLTDKRVHHSP